MKSIRTRQAEAMKRIRAEIETETLPLFTEQMVASGFKGKPKIKWEEETGEVTMTCRWVGSAHDRDEYIELVLWDNNSVTVNLDDAFDESLSLKGLHRIPAMVKGWREEAA